MPRSVTRFRWTLLGFAAGGLALSLSTVSPAVAADRYLRGWRCVLIPVANRQHRGGPQVNKTFEAPDGSVRVLTAGKGSDLLFTNLATGATYTLSGNGAAALDSGSTPMGLLV